MTNYIKDYDLSVEALVSSVHKSKFSDLTFRPGQVEVVYDILTKFLSGTKVVILDAPTGVGKSVIGLVVGAALVEIFDKPALYVTKTIALQHQYQEEKLIRTLYSGDNYACSGTGHAASLVPARAKSHKKCKYTAKSGRCLHTIAKAAFLESDFRCLNYAFFLNAIKGANSAETYCRSSLLMLDEAHTSIGSIVDTYSLTVNKEELLGNIKFNRAPSLSNEVVTALGELETLGLSAISVLQSISAEQADHLRKVYDDLSDKIDVAPSQIKPRLESQIEKVQEHLSYFTDMLSMSRLIIRHPEEWVEVYDEDEDETTLKTINPSRVFDNFVNLSDFILMASATTFNIQEVLKIKDVATIHVPYPWSLDNRPFLANTTLPRINYKTVEQTIPDYVKELDDLIDSLDPEINGIVHSSSYKNAHKIIELSRHADRMMIPNRMELRNVGKLMTTGRVLVSPSLLEGIDLPGKLCEFQVFFKIPYASLGDEWVNAMKDEYDDWYQLEALQSVIQGAGRAIRGPNDIAVTYMLDSGFTKILSGIGDRVPEWFRATVTRV